MNIFWIVSIAAVAVLGGISVWRNLPDIKRLRRIKKM